MSDNTVDTPETSKLDAVKAKARLVWDLSKTPLVRAGIFTAGCAFGARIVRQQVDSYINNLVEENSDAE